MPLPSPSRHPSRPVGLHPAPGATKDHWPKASGRSSIKNPACRALRVRSVGHEAHHLRRRHPLQALVIGALRDGFGWFPAVAATADAYAASREFAADAEAARRCGAEALVSALGKCRHSAMTVEPSGAPGFADLAQTRLKRLTGRVTAPSFPAPARVWLQSAILTLVCSGLGAVACGAAVR